METFGKMAPLQWCVMAPSIHPSIHLSMGKDLNEEPGAQKAGASVHRGFEIGAFISYSHIWNTSEGEGQTRGKGSEGIWQEWGQMREDLWWLPCGISLGQVIWQGEGRVGCSAAITWLECQEHRPDTLFPLAICFMTWVAIPQPYPRSRFPKISSQGVCQRQRIYSQVTQLSWPAWACQDWPVKE